MTTTDLDAYLNVDTDTEEDLPSTKPKLSHFAFNNREGKNVTLDISQLRRICYGSVNCESDPDVAILVQLIDDLNANRGVNYGPANLLPSDIKTIELQLKDDKVQQALINYLERFKARAKVMTSNAAVRCECYEWDLRDRKSHGQWVLDRQFIHFDTMRCPSMKETLVIARRCGKPSLATKDIPRPDREFNAQDFADALNHRRLKWVDDVGTQLEYTVEDATRLIVYLHAVGPEDTNLDLEFHKLSDSNKQALIVFEGDVQHGKATREGR